MANTHNVIKDNTQGRCTVTCAAGSVLCDLNRLRNSFQDRPLVTFDVL